jgi:RsiW-degrading membrane proteinase PrsW (M82 family)
MKDGVEKIEGTLSYTVIWKVFLLAGFLGGILSALLYIVQNFADLTIGNAVQALIAAIFFQTLAFVVYSIIGYGAYIYFAKRRMFGLHAITVSTRKTQP